MVYVGLGTPKILSRPFPNVSSLQWDKWSFSQPLYPPLPRPPRPFGPPPPPLFLPSVRLGRLPPPVISSSVGARDQSLSSSLWSDSVSEALDASELVPGTQIQLHVESRVYFLEHSLINALVEFIPTWGERCPSSSSPSAASSSPSCVGLPSSSASSCSSAHPWSHAVIKHVGFVFEVPRPRPASHASPSYLPQLLVNLKALQTQLIHLLWCEGFK